MNKKISTGQMIDELLSNPSLKFMDKKNTMKVYMDNYGCITFSKFEGHRSTTITLDDKNREWICVDKKNK